MSFSPHHNPITDRMQKLTKQWLIFSENQDARICRWLVQPDEVAMIEAFVKVENANEAQTDDYFIKFRDSFTSEVDYLRSIRDSLKEEKRTLESQLSAEEFKPAQANQAGIKIKNESGTFLHQLEVLLERLEAFKGLLVAVLLPDENLDPDGLVRVLRALIAKGIHPRIRFMVLDLTSHPFLELLATEHPEEVITIQPRLDMDGAMLEIASAGDPADPGVKFRKLLVEMNQHANKGYLADMEHCGEAAAAIAVREGWSDLQINVYFCMAGGYVRAHLVEQALATYEKSENIAYSLWKEGNDLAGRLMVITLLSKGSVYFGEKDYKNAIDTYQKGVEPAADLDDHLGSLELWRMIGTCHEMQHASDEAWEAYQGALSSGANLDSEMRSSSTLPYVGRALLKLADKLGKSKEKDAIEEQMKQLCGEDWERKMVTTS